MHRGMFKVHKSYYPLSGQSWLENNKSVETVGLIQCKTHHILCIIQRLNNPTSSPHAWLELMSMVRQRQAGEWRVERMWCLGFRQCNDDGDTERRDRRGVQRSRSCKTSHQHPWYRAYRMLSRTYAQICYSENLSAKQVRFGYKTEFDR